MSNKTTAADIERLRQALERVHVMDWDQYQAMGDAKIKLQTLINTLIDDDPKTQLIYWMLRSILQDIDKAMDWSE